MVLGEGLIEGQEVFVDPEAVLVLGQLEAGALADLPALVGGKKG